MSTYTIRENLEFNSLEVLFNKKPAAAVIDLLKSLRFRWHNIKKLWYGYANESELSEAIDSALHGKQQERKTEKPASAKHSTAREQPINKYGVKVGDLFYASWGYDQTNLDFFQVVALRGKQSVIVREVNLAQKSEKTISGMSRDVSYYTTGELLPPIRNSVFIKDNEKGDLKRIRDFGASGHPYLSFSISSFASAYPYDGQELYESWYA